MDPQSSSANLSTQMETAQLRALLIRSSTVQTGGMYARRVVAILPGALPTLPFTLPLPEAIALIGSMETAVTHEDTTSQEWDLFWDASLTPQAIFDFYAANLPGWNVEDPLEMMHQRGGFQMHIGMEETQRMYVHPKYGSLHMHAELQDGGQTAVHMKLRESSPMLMRQRRQNRGFDPYAILPVLHAPPDTMQVNEGGGGGSNQVNAGARLIGSIDLVAVESHYTAQLRAAGWELRQSGNTPPIAWSIWQFQDGEGINWDAIFTVFQDAERKNRFRLRLEAHSDNR
jgi:hypothetical protein